MLLMPIVIIQETFKSDTREPVLVNPSLVLMHPQKSLLDALSLIVRQVQKCDSTIVGSN